MNTSSRGWSRPGEATTPPPWPRLEPAVIAGRRDVAPLAARLTLPLQLQPEVDRPVWQCSMRTADGDRSLSDAEWAEVARDVVHRAGFAPHGDASACRWVAVRHADEHIHIAVVLARMDGHPVVVFRDWPKVHAAARAAERRYGLRVVASPNRTAGVAPTRAESEKATRTARAEPARRWLTRQVRAAASGSTSRVEFADRLARYGVLVMWRESLRTPGQITGYAVGRPGDTDIAGRQVWFGGSKLAPDLSLPKLQRRWAETRISGPEEVSPRTLAAQASISRARAAAPGSVGGSGIQGDVMPRWRGSTPLGSDLRVLALLRLGDRHQAVDLLAQLVRLGDAIGHLKVAAERSGDLRGYRRARGEPIARSGGASSRPQAGRRAVDIGQRLPGSGDRSVPRRRPRW